MSRRKCAVKRKVLPDAKYHDVVVSRLVNIIMRHGKKSVAEAIFHDALVVLGEKTKAAEPIKVFKKALDNIKPTLEVKSRRVGGATYQVPVEVKSDRRLALSLRWLVAAASARKEKTAYERLGNELVDASNNTGLSVKKKEETHKMAEANRAFAHYRW